MAKVIKFPSIAAARAASFDIEAQFLTFAHSADALPLPGVEEDATLRRWQTLAALAERDLSLAKLAEGHADAIAILNELGDRSNYRGVWGVWTAEPSNVRLHARPHGTGWRLDGTKTGCAGARYLTDALVTCRCDSGKRLLISVPLRQPGVMVGPDRREGSGLADARIVDVAFTGAVGTRIGGADAYTDRPGFWHGAMGKAACWYGGAIAVATMLREHCATVTDSWALAHLGAVDVALSAARSAAN
jgi:hypothetical protein